MSDVAKKSQYRGPRGICSSCQKAASDIELNRLRTNTRTTIATAAKGPRHGDVTTTTFSANRETIRRSWIVMNRFLEFKKRGNQRLSLSEFPFPEN
jgi:hypothetical protein